MPTADELFTTPITLDGLRPMCEGCHYWRESTQTNCKLVLQMLGQSTCVLPQAIQAAPYEQQGLFGLTERRSFCTRRTEPLPRKIITRSAPQLPGQVAMFQETP
jgi:hypothetical protein